MAKLEGYPNQSGKHQASEKIMERLLFKRAFEPWPDWKACGKNHNSWPADVGWIFNEEASAGQKEV